ncbi:hypothetical protein FHH43_16390 [Clostridium perfringens]|nr:hypothetical protein [Clostridium perfringens]
MKKNFKKIIILSGLIITFLGLTWFSANQNYKLKIYKEDLSIMFSKNLENFSYECMNLYDDESYLMAYGYITNARVALLGLSDRKGVPSEEAKYSLPLVLLDVELLMMNDKEGAKKFLANDNVARTMHNISLDSNDKKSIDQLVRVLDAYEASKAYNF